MEMLTLIVTLSTVMWYIIDRLKPLWSNCSFGKYITMAVAAASATGIVFSYGLDLICAIGMVAEPTIAGQILTAFCLMGGSSAISEIVTKIKGSSPEVE